MHLRHLLLQHTWTYRSALETTQQLIPHSLLVSPIPDLEACYHIGPNHDSVLPTALNCNTFRPQQHSNSSRACRNCCATVTNFNFLIGFCRIPLPLPAQFSLSNSKQQFKFYPRKQTNGLLQPAERTQKEKNIGANDFPAQTDVPQAASQVSALL